MAELLLKVGPGAGYEDGDVLCAFNRRRIRCVHAERLCKLDGYNSDGLRHIGSLGQSLRENIHQYKFQRVTANTIERVNLFDGTIDMFGPESIDVDMFIRRRLKNPNHAIFGIAGSEYWYGGNIDTSNDRLDIVWSKLSVDESTQEFQLWPMGRLDIRHHLAVRVPDFTEEESTALVAPIIEIVGGEEKIFAKRNIKCDWRTYLLDDLKVSERQVLDPNTAVGRDIQLGKGAMRHESKDQPIQSTRSKLWNKTSDTSVSEI